MKKLSERPVLITVITISSIAILYILCIGIMSVAENHGNTLAKEVPARNNEIEYHTSSYILENNSTEKVEKIVLDSNISSYDMQNIYEEKEPENKEYSKYTIWFFSNDENAQNFKEYELGNATRKNGEIEIINVKEENAKKEYEEYQKKIAKEEKAEKEKTEKNFKEDCKTYTYKELARNPDKIEGKKVKLTGEVIQTLYDGDSVDLRVNITKEGTYSTYYTDTIYVVYYPEEGEDRILEDDIITIWGTSQGDYTYTSTIGASVTLPLIFAEYVSID